MPSVFPENLSKIYGNAMAKGEQLAQLKIAQVIALYKKGDKYNPGNYRPISSLLCLNKLFGKTLCKRLVRFLEMNHILFDYPFGFRKLHWWRHQMETFSASLALCTGNSPVPVNCPHKGQWRGALMFSLIWVWINVWVNNREAGDLRRYRAHYDVTAMLSTD